MRKEEVAVLIVVVGFQLERGQLGAAVRRHVLRFRLLLADGHLQVQLAELKVGANAEQRGGTLNQRVVGRERDVTGFNQLHDLVFLTLIFQFQVLRVEVKGGVCVVTQVEVHLVADLGVHRQVYFLVEIEAGGFAVALRKRWVVGELVVVADFQLCGALGLQLNTARTENLLCRTEVEMHVREVKFLLPFAHEQRVVALFEILVDGVALRPANVFLRCHQVWGAQEVVAKFRSHAVEAVLLVVFTCLGFQVLRVLKVERVFLGTLIVGIVASPYLALGHSVNWSLF